MAEVEVQSSADPSSSSRQFPAGLRVLVVDDDSTCLVTMEMMLSKCLYNVTTCTGAKFALSLLRENKGSFDVVLSDVHMPEMNGFELLEIVGLEMDVPVIMMSCDSEANVVMRGMKHGACDYLAKPVRMEVLRNIWQHALRKKERIDQTRRVSGDTANATRNDVADDTSKPHKNKRDGKENDGDDSGEISSKKPRVSWTPNLHQKFLTAVSKLGIDKAAPKGILELMKVPNLTRGNVASHLQKFRRYLKNLTEGKQSGQMPPDLVAALSAQMLGPVTNLGDRNYSQKVSNMLLPILRQQQPHPLLQESPHAVNLQPSCLFPNQPSNTFQAAVQSQQLTSFQAGKNPFLLNWNNPLVVQTVNNHLLMNPNNRLLMDQNSERIPTQPLANFGAGNNPIIMSQAENRPIPINQRSNYILFYGTRQISAEDCNNVGVMSNSSVSRSVPSPVSYIRPSGGLGGPNSGNNHNPGMMETDQGQRRNVNFVDQGTCIAARCVINDVRSPENNLSEDEDLLKEYFLEDIFDGSTEDEDLILPDFLK